MANKIAVVGASGRMGQLITHLVMQESDLELHSQLNSKSDLAELLGADLVVDVSRPEVSPSVADFAIENKLRLLIGTSGWSTEKLERLRNKVLGTEAIISVIPNFSIGSVLATEFVAKAGQHFDSIEIVETHHPKKLDAPSGTALFTASEIAKRRREPVRLEPDHAELHSGIPITSKRIEGAHAIQEVRLWGEMESLYVRHEVTSHEAYSAGILLAIRKTLTGAGLRVGLMELLEDDSR